MASSIRPVSNPNHAAVARMNRGPHTRPGEASSAAALDVAGVGATGPSARGSVGAEMEIVNGLSSPTVGRGALAVVAGTEGAVPGDIGGAGHEGLLMLLCPALSHSLKREHRIKCRE